MRRMARGPAVAVSPAPRHPPPDMIEDFTLDGRCPLAANVWYFDQSNTSSSQHPLYFNASRCLAVLS